MNDSQQQYRQLLDLAHTARQGSYCPYSGFSVGAAILTASGQTFTGANVENASYGMCICAERAAAVKAVNAGDRHFIAVACVGGIKDDDKLEYCSPCGACRQFLNEFDSDCIIIGESSRQTAEIIAVKLSDLLPRAFGPNNLAK